MPHPAASPYPAPTSIGVMWGVGDIVTMADDAYLTILRYTREDLEAGRINWRDMTPPEQVHLDEAGIRQAIESGGFTQPYQKEFIRKDGTRVPVLLVCAILPDQPDHWMGYVVDLSLTSIAGRMAPVEAPTAFTTPLPEDFYRRLVGQLVSERARLSEMLDATGSPMWAVNQHRTLIAGNKAFQRAQRRVSGRRLDIGESVLAPEFPEAARQWWDALYSRAFAGERVTVSTEDASDGHTHRHDHVLTPMRDSSGHIFGVTVTAHDVTERLAAEDALRTSETRFRTLASGSPLGIFLADANGDVVYVNERMRSIYQMPTEAMLGLGTSTVIHPEDKARVMAEWFGGVHEQRDLYLEFRLLLADDEIRHIRTWVSCLRSGDRVTGYVGSVEDATEPRAMAQRTKQRERLESLGTLAGGIAHDFNNMLGIVLGYAELGLADKSLPGMVRTDLNEIRTASLRARDLVRQILTFSRHTEGEHVPVDLAALARESGRLLRATVSAHVALDVRAPDKAITVLGNASALQQVIVNLCVNAEHALRDTEAPAIQIDLRHEVHAGVPTARLTIRDNGHGMTPAIADRIFEPFFTTRQVGGGTGMGLAVVHGTVLAHGGTINVDTAPGSGTTFVITLPVCASTVITAPHAAISGPGTGTVLLVEDEPQLATALTRALEQAGYNVTSCATATEALRLIAAGRVRPDVVLSDVAMPGITGDRMARDLEVLHPDLPVVLMTGFSEEVQPDGPRGRNVLAVLQKPISVAALAEVLGKVLA